MLDVKTTAIVGVIFIVSVSTSVCGLGSSGAQLLDRVDATATTLKAFKAPVTGPRVLIELFVMSRCPDARRAEARFDDVLALVHTIADIRTVYIADEANNGSVTCKHGPIECDGDVQQLCAQRYGRPRNAGEADLGWSFLVCQNKQFGDMGSYELAESCLQASRFSGRMSGRVRACWSGNEGRQALRESARESHSRGVSRSCTVFIGGEYRCTHDDAQWYDCPGGAEVGDFVRTVCKQYERLTGSWPSDVCGEQQPSSSQPEHHL